MALEIINSIRTPSIIRTVDPGTYTISLANLSYNANETVNFANIRKLNWSTNGNITIVRNSVPLMTLHNAGELRCDDFGFSLANNNTQSIVVTINTGGSLVMEVTKDCNYTTALIG
jgi:hypothetical protein